MADIARFSQALPAPNQPFFGFFRRCRLVDLAGPRDRVVLLVGRNAHRVQLPCSAPGRRRQSAAFLPVVKRLWAACRWARLEGSARSGARSSCRGGRRRAGRAAGRGRSSPTLLARHRARSRATWPFTPAGRPEAVERLLERRARSIRSTVMSSAPTTLSGAARQAIVAVSLSRGRPPGRSGPRSPAPAGSRRRRRRVRRSTTTPSCGSSLVGAVVVGSAGSAAESGRAASAPPSGPAQRLRAVMSCMSAGRQQPIVARRSTPTAGRERSAPASSSRARARSPRGPRGCRSRR